MERNGRRRMAWLALLASLVLVLAACSRGTGDGDGTGAPTGEPRTGPGPIATGGEPFSLSPGFAAVTMQGRSGGNVDASTHGDDCVGNIASRADHEMTVTGGPVTAMLGVTSDADTTLVVLGPGGPYCNDDFDGLNPGIQATFQPGTYQVFIGNYSADEGPTSYTLTVSPAQAEEQPVDPTVPTMPPTTPPTMPPTMGTAPMQPPPTAPPTTEPSGP
jgi:hypothetical protein